MKARWYIPGLCFLFISLTARSEDKIHIHLDYNQMFGLYEKYKYWSINGFKHSMGGFDLGITGMYDVNRCLSVGAGMAAGVLGDQGYIIFPVYATAHYAPLKRSVKPYLFVKTGYLAKTAISEPGVLFSTGIGYKLKFREHFGLNFTLGYQFTSTMHEIEIYDLIGYDDIFTFWGVVDTDRSAVYIHSVSLGLGFVF
jgi:long-subunit fatty acid transport protein